MSVHLVHNAEMTMDLAVDWVQRLQGETLSVEDGLAFDAWLEESPANALAYEHVLSLLSEIDAAAPEILTGVKRAEHRAAKQLVGRRWTIGAGLGALAASIAAAVVILPQGELIAQTSGYATTKGEHRSLKLADGSTIDMNAETGMSVTLAPHGRRVVMGPGEAVFDVAHDTTRPFEIEAGGRIVHVVGTQFDVRNRPEGFSVTVSRGVVQVRGGGPTYVLRKGDSLELNAAGVTKVSSVNPADALAWRTGHVVYRDQPLSRVVADLNRQFPEQVRISDERLAQEKVSGVLVLDDQNQVLERLALMLPIKALRSDQGVVLQPK
jgi:transmembrane sensor